jgi:hypothetical protein
MLRKWHLWRFASLYENSLHQNPVIDTPLADIIDRRNESRRYYQLNYWDEFVDAYMAIKCRTKQITKQDRKGNEIEDLTRTNVAMPEMSLIRRRKVARLTAQPPKINYTSSGQVDPMIAEKLTSLAYMQFDRSDEAKEHRRVVDSAMIFGRGISKVFYDTIEVERLLRRDLLTFRDRRKAMESQGADPEEIENAVQANGEQYSDAEITEMIAKSGPELKGKFKTTQYEGPVVRVCFIGDVFDEPGARTLNESGWIVENYFENELFLKKMMAKTYCDPETGEELPVFDPKECQGLMEMGSWNPNQGTQQPYDLRTRLRTTGLAQTLPLFPTRLLPGKRFDIIECHERDKEGQMWITWIGNEKFTLGRMPYQWNFYGKSCYTEFVPQPDPIGAVGDSQIRLLKGSWALHNAAAGSRRDLVNQILRPVIPVGNTEDVPEEVFERSLYRVVVVRNPATFRPMNDNGAAAGAIEAANNEEAQCLRMIGMAEPSLNNVDTGTEANPQAGRTATTAVLAAKSADALTNDEINQLEVYFKELGEKKLWMNQQSRERGQPWSIDPKYIKTQGLSQRYGRTAAIQLDPMEIQEDFQVEPEAGSMLAVDDDIHRQAGMQAYQMAMSDPQNWDTNYVASTVAKSIRGIDAEKAVPPPKPPPPPPPPKVSVSIAVKFETLPPDVQQQFLQEIGMQPSQDLQVQSTLDGIERLGKAANAAHDMLQDPSQEGVMDSGEPETSMTKGVNGG